MSEFQEIAYARAAIWQLALIGCVAILAYATRRRSVALFGGLGVFLGFIIPQRRVYADYRTVEAAYIGALNDTTFHLVAWAVVGVTIGTCVGFLLSYKRNAPAIPNNSKTVPRVSI